MTDSIAQIDQGVRTYYDKIISRTAGDLEEVSPEKFTPRPGFILVVVPPSEEETKGGISLPDAVRVARNVARVAAVPPMTASGNDIFVCPFSPGDVVLFAPGAGMNVNFGGRSDLKLLEYTEDIRSEVIGVLDIDL